MFVRQLIGRQAGEIVEMPYHAAEACLSNGTVQRVTDAEIVAAGMTPPEPPPVEAAPMVPHGYEAISRLDDQGYDLFRQPVTRNERGDVTDEPVNEKPLHNLAALRDFITQVVEAPKPADPQPADIPEGWQDLNAADMKALAVALGADPAPATKADATAFVQSVVDARAADSKPADPQPADQQQAPAI